jgi:hypothetical protein
MIRRVVSFAGVVCTLVSLAACGTSTGTAPSGTTATINGTLTSSSGAAHLTSAARPAVSFSGMTVSVQGSNQQAVVDASNTFILSGLTPGNIVLQFAGSGGSGSVTLAGVTAGDILTATFLVANGTVTLTSDNQVSGATVEADGFISSILSGSTFGLNGLTISTSTATTIVRGATNLAFSDLTVGTHVLVTGTQTGTTVAATRVEIEDAGSTQPLTVSGTVTSLSGSASSFQFTLSSTIVEGDNSTAFTSGSFASLQNGALVTVIGTQGAGFVKATSIQIN